MSELEVRIVTIEPMRVASVHGFGPSPERVAWDKLVAWARPRGLLDGRHRIFGFNNPNPSPGSPNYGYEFWIAVGADVAPEGDVRLHEFAGGRYAVARCRGVDTITPTWQRLVAWLAGSAYGHAGHQWLEEHIGAADVSPDQLVLDLYAPIAG